MPTSKSNKSSFGISKKPKKSPKVKAQSSSKTIKTTGLFSNKNILIMVAAALLIIGMLLLIPKKSETTTPVADVEPSGGGIISLVSESDSVAVGDKIKVKLFSNSGDIKNNAVEATIEYPEEILELSKINSDTSAYPIKAQETITKGKATISRGVIGGVSEKQLIAELEFTAKASGSAKVSFNELGTVLLSAETNKNILNKTGFESASIEVIK
jgi:hypothetical protein